MMLFYINKYINELRSHSEGGESMLGKKKTSESLQITGLEFVIPVILSNICFQIDSFIYLFIFNTIDIPI